MNWAEALAVLGFDAPPEAAELKRAYHQRLRVTKPDQDPEGFQRLRQAYELLQRVRVVMSQAPVSADDVGAEGDQDEDESGFDDADQGAEPFRVVVPPEPLLDGPEDAMARIRRLTARTTMTPDDPRPWEQLITTFVELGLDSAAHKVLEVMGERHALLQWRLRVRLLPDKTTTFQLRNPPEGATLADRLQALFVLVDVHRWSGESVPIAGCALRGPP